MDEEYTTLDLRLEAAEQVANEAVETAENAENIAQQALDAISNIQGDINAAAVAMIRKVGVTVDAVTGIKGAIQLDFGGEIIGWSVIADMAGDLTVEVDRKASSAPPSAPAIPNTTTDKISADAPIILSGAQSAASAAAGVASWAKTLMKWDVIQFTYDGCVHDNSCYALPADSGRATRASGVGWAYSFDGRYEHYFAAGTVWSVGRGQ